MRPWPRCRPRAFQLTHLLRGATRPGWRSWKPTKFQLTHLLRGATSPVLPFRPCLRYFNSRTSCEVRLPSEVAEKLGVISTHAPLARCDEHPEPVYPSWEISTHAPLARCDWMQFQHLPWSPHFNSRTSCEVRHKRNPEYANGMNFNSRTSCEVRPSLYGCYQCGMHFNSRTSCEVRRYHSRVGTPCAIFQLTHLLRGATRRSRDFPGRT